MRIALYTLFAVAVVLAWIIAARRSAHRPIALALSVALAADIGRALLLSRVLPPHRAPTDPPLGGVLLLAAYVDRALFIAWPAALAAAAVRVLLKRRAWAIAIGYAAAVGVLVAWYPALRFGALRKAYLAIELAALVVSLFALIAYRIASRGAGADVSVRVAAVLVAGHFAAIVSGPYRFDLFGEGWALVQLAYIVIFGAVIVLQIGEVIIRDTR